MDRARGPHQGFPAQYHDEDDLILTEEEFNHQQGTATQLNDDLMLSADEFDLPSHTSPCDDDLMLPFVDFDYQQDGLARQHNFELEIPRYLPEDALVTNSASLVHADGHEERYLTILNTPVNNYVAHKINDGHEFAIGGDPSHILMSLDQEFGSQPQQRWHVIVIPEDNLQLVGAPRQSYPLVSGMADESLQIADESGRFQPSINCGDYLMSGALVSPVRRGHSTEALNHQPVRCFNGLSQPQQDHEFRNGPMNGGPVHPPLQGFGNPGFIGQNNDFNVHIRNGSVNFPNHPFNYQGPQSQPNHDFFQHPATLLQTAPAQNNTSQPSSFLEDSKQRQPRQVSMEHGRSQREMAKNQKKEDAATIEADDRFDNYSGTNLCRWCGRRGHEAVQCIKWDPVHFDKLVCIVCNNRKHSIDECSVFQAKPNEARVKLLLVDGAKKPGVRSFFYPWTQYAANLDQYLENRGLIPSITEFPMTRAFIKRLASTEPGGKMWSNLWKTFPYGDCKVPEAFHDKELVLKDQDECYDAEWPLIVQDGDQVAVSPALEYCEAN